MNLTFWDAEYYNVAFFVNSAAIVAQPVFNEWILFCVYENDIWSTQKKTCRRDLYFFIKKKK